MKMVTHQTAQYYGRSLIMSTYHNMKPKSVMKMIDKLADKCPTDLVVYKSGKSLLFPQINTEMSRISHRKFQVLTVLGEQRLPSESEVKRSGYTHGYEWTEDDWYEL